MDKLTIRKLANDDRITSRSPLIYRQSKALAKRLEAAEQTTEIVRLNLRKQLEAAEATIKASDELADEWENDETLGRERDGIICADQLRKLLRSRNNG